MRCGVNETPFFRFSQFFSVQKRPLFRRKKKPADAYHLLHKVRIPSSVVALLPSPYPAPTQLSPIALSPWVSNQEFTNRGIGPQMTRIRMTRIRMTPKVRVGGSSTTSPSSLGCLLGSPWSLGCRRVRRGWGWGWEVSVESHGGQIGSPWGKINQDYNLAKQLRLKDVYGSVFIKMYLPCLQEGVMYHSSGPPTCV